MSTKDLTRVFQENGFVIEKWALCSNISDETKDIYTLFFQNRNCEDHNFILKFIFSLYQQQPW